MMGKNTVAIAVCLLVCAQALVIPLERRTAPVEEARAHLTKLQEEMGAMSNIVVKPVHLINFMLAQYYGTVEVGGQKMKVLFDTGSADLLVPSVYCPEWYCGAHARYDPRRSDDCNKNCKQDLWITEYIFKYGSGAVQGYMCQDRVEFGGLKIDSQFFGHFFGVSDEKMNRVLKSSGFDGILGLAYPEVSTLRQLPVMDNFISKYFSTEKESQKFAFYLSRTEGNQGAFIMGSTDIKEYFDGSMQYIPIDHCEHKEGRYCYWQVKMDSLSVKDIDHPANEKKLDIVNNNAIFDTGSSLIMGPLEQIHHLYLTICEMSKSLTKEECASLTDRLQTPEERIRNICTDVFHEVEVNQACWEKIMLSPGSTLNFPVEDELPYIPCKRVDGLPAIVFTLGGLPFHFGPEDYIFRFVDTNDGGIEKCIVGFVPHFSNKRSWYLGDVFMRTYFTVFHRGTNSVGLAKAKQSVIPTPKYTGPKPSRTPPAAILPPPMSAYSHAEVAPAAASSAASSAVPSATATTAPSEDHAEVSASPEWRTHPTQPISQPPQAASQGGASSFEDWAAKYL